MEALLLIFGAIVLDGVTAVLISGVDSTVGGGVLDVAISPDFVTTVFMGKVGSFTGVAIVFSATLGFSESSVELLVSGCACGVVPFTSAPVGPIGIGGLEPTLERGDS